MIEKLKRLWKKFVELNPTNNDLYYIVWNIESLRVEAGQKLLTQNPTNDELCDIIKYIESLRTEAQKLLSRTKNQILKTMKELSSS